MVGARCLALELLLFLDERCHITDDAVGTCHLPVVVEDGDTVYKVPLQFFALMEEWAHVGEVGPWYAEEVLVVHETCFEGTFYKVVPEFLDGHDSFGYGHALIECAGLVGQGGAEESHVACAHQILQLVLIFCNLFVDAADFCVIVFVLQIQLSLLGDIANGEGDIDEFVVFAVDRVYMHFCVAVHTSLDDDALGTEEQFLDMPVVEYLTEGGHVVDGVAVVEGIVL